MLQVLIPFELRGKYVDRWLAVTESGCAMMPSDVLPEGMLVTPSEAIARGGITNQELEKLIEWHSRFGGCRTIVLSELPRK